MSAAIEAAIVELRQQIVIRQNAVTSLENLLGERRGVVVTERQMRPTPPPERNEAWPVQEEGRAGGWGEGGSATNDSGGFPRDA
jgi:hypothetical protein